MSTDSKKFKYIVQDFVLHDSLHLILFFSLLSAFYFIYVTKQEDHGAILLINKLFGFSPNDKSDDNLDEIIRIIVNNLSPDTIDTLKKKSEKEEKERKIYNDTLVRKTIKAILSILLVLLILNICIFIYYKNDYKANFMRSIYMNIISITILGIVEFMFFTYIIKRYRRMRRNSIFYNTLMQYHK